MSRIAKLVGFGIIGLSINIAGVTTSIAARANLLTSTSEVGTNLVYACVNNVNKSVRIVGARDNCSNNETPRQWSITGPQDHKDRRGRKVSKDLPVQRGVVAL